MEHQTKQAEYIFGNIPEIDNKKNTCMFNKLRFIIKKIGDHCKSALIKKNLATLYRYSNFDLLFCFLSYVQRILQLMECDIDIILH